MPQNSIRSRLRRAAWQITPAPILHLVFGARLRGMGRLIDAAAIKGARRIDVPGVSIACCQLDLADGTVIVSTPPSHNNVKITHAARRKLGLGPEYAKALVDLVVRYSYPHAMVPVLRIPVVDRERGGLHLQHRNLPQETSDFSAPTRDFLETHFTPQPDWNTFDTMPPDLRPWRMVMPGWYPNDAGPRSKPIVAKLQALGYQTLVTSHNFVIAWRIGT
jgi:hypothetical protein